MEISKRTAVCLARHTIAAHESACTQKPVDFGKVCAECSEIADCLDGGRMVDWIKTTAPFFDAVGLHPQLARTEPAEFM